MMTLDSNIKVIVFELTNKTDLRTEKGGQFLDFSLFNNLLKQNMKLTNQIKIVELGGSGDPLLHPKIEEMLELLSQYNIRVVLVTNGLNFRKNISRFDDSILSNIHFCLYLDHPNQEKNDNLMGKGVFKKTIESMEYLIVKGLKYDILMRINSKNHNKIEEMLELCKHYNCNLIYFFFGSILY